MTQQYQDALEKTLRLIKIKKEREEIIALCCSTLGVQLQFDNLPLLMDELAGALQAKEAEMNHVKVSRSSQSDLVVTVSHSACLV